MKTILFVVFATLLAVASAQNAPAINWAQVRPIHQVPSFFRDYPFLFNLFGNFNPNQLAWEEEGRNATRNQYPYQVGLVLNRGDGLGFCSGSLISTEWILTAAHCVEFVTTGTAILGGWDISNGAEAGQSRFIINQFFIHPGWNGMRLTDDVALVRLPSAVVFNANIQAIRLSNLRQISSTYLTQMTHMSGWGRALFSPATVARNVRLAQFHIFSTSACRLMFPGLLESAQMCAVSSEPSGPRCPGDAGAPLVVTEADNIPTQVGITSFISGLGCEGTRPSIFTRLNFYLRWIAGVTNIVIAPDFVF